MSIEFKLSNNGIQRMTTSQWECRNIGLEKILNGAYPYIMKEIVDIKKPIKIIIQTHDFPYPITKKDKYTIELQTISETFIEDLFPDYVHGNWWHIGLTDFDEFTKDIVTSCLSNDPIYNKIFWAGSVQNIPQRQKYKSISYSHPNKFETFTMSWRGNSKPSKFIKLRDQWQWDILIDLTGHGWSGRLKLLPYCHRPLIISFTDCS